MAFNIKRTDNGILVENRFLFSPSTIEVGIVNLLPTIGAEMAYDRGNLLSIDFPGEYDIAGALIKVFVGHGDKLNFLVSYDDMKFGIIQSPEVLELDEVCDMNYWIFPDESIEKKLDQLEMEGARINLSKIDDIDIALMESETIHNEETNGIVEENGDEVDEKSEEE